MKTTSPLPIVNAKKPLVLHITKGDLRSAEQNRKDPNWCVIACAARREFGADDVKIHLSRIYIRRGQKWQRFVTSKALRSEIIAFDRGGTFAPGEFWLSPPPPSKQRGGQQGSAKPPSYMRPRNPRHNTEDVRPWAGSRGPR